MKGSGCTDLSADAREEEAVMKGSGCTDFSADAREEEAVMKGSGCTDLSADARELLPEHDKLANKIEKLAKKAKKPSFFSWFGYRGASIPGESLGEAEMLATEIFLERPLQRLLPRIYGPVQPSISVSSPVLPYRERMTNHLLGVRLEREQGLHEQTVTAKGLIGFYEQSE